MKPQRTTPRAPQRNAERELKLGHYQKLFADKFSPTHMPRLNNIAATFPVGDIESTIRWYESELGFTAYPFPQTPPYVFAIVSRDTVEIMFQRVAGYQKPDLYHQRAGGVWDAYIRMEGVKQFYESIKDKVEIVLPLRQQPYGDWEFEVKDPNGYILVFSELID